MQFQCFEPSVETALNHKRRLPPPQTPTPRRSANHPRWVRSHQLIEFTDGYLEGLSLPTRSHQRMLARLYELFVAFLRLHGGEVLFALLRLQIRPGKQREPDLLLVVDEHDPRNQDRFWLGADLVVEIVSADNPERDTVEKVADCAEAQIPEYWIVNPLDETTFVAAWAEGQAMTLEQAIAYALGEGD